ncbi:MAG: Coenzyme F420 hydrogenase/dehydrogenase, beta subunit C-terminal domain [Fibrobacteria bacterium]|nr:Coenzyme F420 hydrogenase/dehydrogenase, beta subunit C-terminal domain [Fibrobacteria bacterium]
MNPQDITSKNLCLGCGLCVAQGHAEKLEWNSDGFLIPTGSHPHNASIATEQICPGVLVDLPATPGSDPLWGYTEEIVVAHSTHKGVRQNGSSGGIVTELARQFLLHGLVDGVIHVVSDSSDPFLNRAVISTTLEQIESGASSRYAPASSLQVLTPELLQTSAKYLLVGKPCDISGLRNLQATDPRWKSKIPFTIAIFCAGMPSREGTIALVKKLGLSGDTSKVKYRGDGWPGKFIAWNELGESVSTSYSDSWGSTLNRFLHPRCKICPDGIGLQADFSVGDAWETQDGYPDFHDREGESLVLVRTKECHSLFHSWITEGAIELVGQRNREYLETIQKFQAQRRIFARYRWIGWTLGGGFKPRFRGVFGAGSYRFTEFSSGLRQLMGTLKRSKKLHS